MKITILTLFPEMYEGFLNTSIIKRTLDRSVVEIEVVSLRPFSTNKHKNVDDTPYGGGQGMVLACQPVVDAIEAIQSDQAKVYLMAPFGKKLDQKLVRNLAKEEHLIFVCGHYEGMDQRIENYVDGALSIGDYILTGGELASMVITDAVTRTLDGAITEASHLDESFENGLLEYPQYTKPEVFRDYAVPRVLLTGNHQKIASYRLKESLRRTLEYRPDLLTSYSLTQEEKELFTKLQIEKKYQKTYTLLQQVELVYTSLKNEDQKIAFLQKEVACILMGLQCCDLSLLSLDQERIVYYLKQAEGKKENGYLDFNRKLSMQLQEEISKIKPYRRMNKQEKLMLDAFRCLFPCSIESGNLLIQIFIEYLIAMEIEEESFYFLLEAFFLKL